MQEKRTPSAGLLKALSNENRMTILEWLLEPTAHFPPQVDGDLEDDGVCLGAVVRKMGVSQPAVTAHMRILAEEGLVRPTRIKNWVFYKADEAQIEAALADLRARLLKGD